MGDWEDLQNELGAIRVAHPEALYAWAGADHGRPWRIHLAAWAVDIARGLHERFGEQVDLTVGFLHYPDRRSPGRAERPSGFGPGLEVIPPEVARFRLAAPLTVASGHDVAGRLDVTAVAFPVEMSGAGSGVTPVVIDPGSGEIVGGFAGVQPAIRRSFTARVGETIEVPLLLGTASLVARLGYSVPPGRWAAEAIVVGDGRSWRSPPIPLTVI